MIEESIRNRLINYAGLSALVSSRVYSRLPQNVTYPAVLYRRISTAIYPAMSTDAGVEKARFQLSVFAETLSESKSVSAQVRAALKRYRGTILGVVIQDITLDDETDLYEDDVDIYQNILDFMVFYEV